MNDRDEFEPAPPSRQEVWRAIALMKSVERQFFWRGFFVGLGLAVGMSVAIRLVGSL